LRHESCHGAERFLDRHGRIDPVLVVKIDHVDAEPLEALLAGADDIVRPALGDLALAPAEIAEFGRQHHPAAPTLDGLADQLLVMAEAVHVGGVEQRDPAVERLLDQRDPVLIGARPIDAGQRHAAETDGGDLDAGCAQEAFRNAFAVVHRCFLP